MTTVRFNSWSPSRLADYDQCPLMAKHKHLLKTCPICFKGMVRGGYGTPAICDTCGETIVKGEALERGARVGDAHDAYLLGSAAKPHKEVKHPTVLALSKEVRAEIKKNKARVQLDIVLNRQWTPCKGWDKGAWGRFKLDLLRFIDKTTAKVIDWKTGGIDKRTGAVRAEAKYDDQLSAYSLATLCALPQVENVSSALVFLDCGARFDPVVERPSGSLTRAKLPKAQAAWEKRLRPMFSDETFAPKPSDRCRWCDFRKERGGPCKF